MSEPIVAVIGEALVDLADDTPRPGGSPLNVATGLARLGQPTAFLGRFARDDYGRLLRAHAMQSGVDLRDAVDAIEPSTVARVRLDERGSARYEFSVDGTADFAWTDGELATIASSVRVVHFGSLASWLPPGAAVIDRRLAALRAEGRVLISYDPNVRPTLQPDPALARTRVETSLRHAHLVKASDEDVHYLYPDEPVEAIAARWQRMGPALVVITRGAAEPLAAMSTGTFTRPSHPVQVVDTVGAGDAFTSGLLDALVRAGVRTPDQLTATNVVGAALDDAALVAALTCSRAGANPPTRTEVDAARSAATTPRTAR